MVRMPLVVILVHEVMITMDNGTLDVPCIYKQS